MSNDLNQCNFIGRLGGNPDIRFTSDQKQVTSFSIACGWKTKNGEGTEWVNITTFGRLAEVCGEYLKKGSRVFISGRIKTEKYEKDGQTHYSTKIVANSMQMLDSKPDSQAAQPAQQPAQQGSAGGDVWDDDIPFAHLEKGAY